MPLCPHCDKSLHPLGLASHRARCLDAKKRVMRKHPLAIFDRQSHAIYGGTCQSIYLGTNWLEAARTLKRSG